MYMYNVDQEYGTKQALFSFHIHNILSFLNALLVYIDDGKFVGKRYIEDAPMTKSCNIVLSGKMGV